ncbi:PFA3 [Symbiodinium sp. CCMP2592]|nr:PFA3 [Symbiodinium sp. CCMP2592]
MLPPTWAAGGSLVLHRLRDVVVCSGSLSKTGPQLQVPTCADSETSAGALTALAWMLGTEGWDRECRMKAWITKHAGRKPAFNEPRLCWSRRCGWQTSSPEDAASVVADVTGRTGLRAGEPGLEEALRPQHSQSGVRRSWARRPLFSEEGRKNDTAVSHCELRASGPVVQAASSICLAWVHVPVLCRLQSWPHAEAGSHCRLCIMLDTDIWRVRWRGSIDSLASGVGCGDCSPDAVARACLELLGSIRAHPMILHCRYCSLADPGTLRKTLNTPLDLEQGERPLRAHESWQYGRKIRRYDHYCKWVHNVIGLLNHREFVVMLVCLCVIGLFGVILDVYLALLLAQKGMWEDEIAVVSHLAFSVGLLAIEGPIFKIHIGLVSRNELGQEWKHHTFYVVARDGNLVPVDDLDVDEYNQLFDSKAFIYDSSRNRWDNGWTNNCWKFWCWPRWPAGELGEF